MKGIELLAVSQEYTIRTEFREYPNLVFTGFSTESNGVTLACFDDVQNGWESFFDISVPTNEVILKQKEFS